MLIYYFKSFSRRGGLNKLQIIKEEKERTMVSCHSLFIASDRKLPRSYGHLQNTHILRSKDLKRQYLK